FIERRHIKDVLAFVKILYNPNDTIAWHRILTLFKGVGAVTATRLTQAINADSNVNNNVNSDVNNNVNSDVNSDVNSNVNNTFEPLLAPSFAKKSPQLKSLHTTLTKASQAESVEIVIELI